MKTSQKLKDVRGFCRDFRFIADVLNTLRKHGAGKEFLKKLKDPVSLLSILIFTNDDIIVEAGIGSACDGGRCDFSPARASLRLCSIPKEQEETVIDKFSDRFLDHFFWTRPLTEEDDGFRSNALLHSPGGNHMTIMQVALSLRKKYFGEKTMGTQNHSGIWCAHTFIPDLLLSSNSPFYRWFIRSGITLVAPITDNGTESLLVSCKSSKICCEYAQFSPNEKIDWKNKRLVYRLGILPDC